MKKHLIALVSGAMFLMHAQAQTDPTAVSLPFSLTSQSSSTLPSGVAVHKFSTIPTTRTVSPAAADLGNQGSSPTATAGGWYHLGTDGIGILASSTTQSGALVVAINTTGQSNISVSWICKTIFGQSSRDNSVALQYRVGTSGNFTDVGSLSTYTSTGHSNGHASSTLTEMLPVGAENQSVVQVRWIYWESAGSSGSRDKISIDEISIGSGTSVCSAPSNLTSGSITTSGATIGWDAVSGAVTYEYAVTTSATPPGSGTSTSLVSNPVSGLTANTAYYYHVRGNCGGSNFSGWSTGTFTTLPVCATPGGLNETGITQSTATIHWNIVSGASSYEYSISASATPPGSGTNTASTSYGATGLSVNTLYYYHVRTNCGSGNFSTWATDSFYTNEDTATAGQFTVMTYNLLNYSASTGAARDASFRIIMDDAQPDILVVQEVSQSNGISSFLNNVLNYTTTTYSSGTFVDGPDTDNGIFYKTSKFQFISNKPIATALRDINEFKLKHIYSGDTIIIYSVHLKASTGFESNRAAEVDNLRAITNALPSGKSFLVCGDFNIYGDSEPAYTKLLENGSNANGKFNDLITMTGTWNNSSYAINHTQSPRTTSFGGGATGGMDDRFDMILFSTGIVNAGGFDIVSSTYKAYGNDGNHYNAALNTPPYTMYSSTLQGALHDCSDHIPVIVKLSH